MFPDTLELEEVIKDGASLCLISSRARGRSLQCLGCSFSKKSLGRRPLPALTDRRLSEKLMRLQNNSLYLYEEPRTRKLFNYIGAAKMGRVGGRNLMASRVYQSATMFLENKLLEHMPPWYTTIGSIPPPEILTRTLPPQHRDRNPNSRVRKPSKMFKPVPIEFEEDRLRKEFYSDHPWELARPRIILENDGKDGQRCDWSRIQQLGRPLNGESVIQRQLWLMNHGGLSKNEAYDVARKEFYALRHEEEVERRVAKEEALWVGASFGKGMLEVGMELEDKAYEGWKEWAELEIQAMERRRDAAYTGVGTKNADDESSALDETIETELDEEAAVEE